MISFGCQLDRIKNNLEDKPIVVPGMGFLDSVDWGWKAHCDCEQHHAMGWDPALIKMETEHQH